MIDAVLLKPFLGVYKLLTSSTRIHFFFVASKYTSAPSLSAVKSLYSNGSSNFFASSSFGVEVSASFSVNCFQNSGSAAILSLPVSTTITPSLWSFAKNASLFLAVATLQLGGALGQTGVAVFMGYTTTLSFSFTASKLATGRNISTLLPGIAAVIYTSML